MKKILLLSFIFSASLLFCNSAKADESYSHVLTLSPGWNVISVPRVVENHSFSVSETLANLIFIFWITPNLPAGRRWRI